MNTEIPGMAAPGTWLTGWPAVGAVVLTVALILGYQTRVTTAVRQENEALRATADTAEALRAQNRDYEKLAAENSDLDRLRRDAAELQELRQTTEQLRQQVREIENLRADNQRMQSALAQRKTSATPANVNEAFFDTAQNAREKALSIQCVNNLKQIGLAVRIWASEHEDRSPTSVLQMSDALGTPLILLCPADTTKESIRQSLQGQGTAAGSAQQGSAAAALFSRLGPSFPSYTLYLTGDEDGLFPQRILSKCPIHGHVGLADGSVQMDPLASGGGREEMVDGRLTLVPPDPPLQLDPEASELLTDPEVIQVLQERYGLSPEQLSPPEEE